MEKGIMMPDFTFIKILLAMGDWENIDNVSIFSKANCNKKKSVGLKDF